MTHDDVASSQGSNPTIDTPQNRTSVISTRTRVVGGIMLLALAAGVTFDYLAQAGIFGDPDFALAGLGVVPFVIAALILGVTSTFTRGVIRTQWMLFGLGMLAIGIGNIALIAVILVTGEDPYPSLLEFFTLSGYGLFAAAFVLAIRSYRGLLDVRKPLIIAAIVAAAAMALVYSTVIGPYVVFAPDGSQSLATRIFNTLYPILDVFVLFMPAVTLGLLLGRLGAGRVAWPWWLVVSSATILALTDTIFAYATYSGAGRTPIIDAGYALAPLLLGLAVLVAWDVYHS